MNYVIKHSHARNIAERTWGRDGTTARRTTRPGFYFFSCSGHGGYVVEAQRLTEEERRILRDDWDAPYEVLDDEIDGQPVEVLLFEEDANALYLEYVVGVRCGEATVPSERLLVAIAKNEKNRRQLHLEDAARESRRSDVVVSAVRIGSGRVKVWLADGTTATVKDSYGDRKAISIEHEDGLVLMRYLERCSEEEVAPQDGRADRLEA